MLACDGASGCQKKRRRIQRINTSPATSRHAATSFLGWPLRQRIFVVSRVPKGRRGQFLGKPEIRARRDVRLTVPVRFTVRINGPPTGEPGGLFPIDVVVAWWFLCGHGC